MDGESLVDPGADHPFCRRRVAALAASLPVSRPLQALADGRHATAFTNLVVASLVADAHVDAAVLAAGVSLLPQVELVAAVAGRANGEVAEALIAAVDRGGLDGWTQGACLLIAAFWCKREGRPVPSTVAARARSVARWAPDDDTLAVVLAVAELADDPHLSALLVTLDDPAWGPLVREVADALASSFVGNPMAWVPEHPAVALPPERREKVGRNDACPCGSGNKYKRCCEGKPLAEAPPVLPESLHTLPPHALAHWPPDAVPQTRRAEVLTRLVQGSEVDAVERLLDAWPGHHELRVEAIAAAAIIERTEVARRLLEGADAPVPLSATIGLLDPPIAVEHLEAQAAADLDTGSVITAWAALRGPMPMLGVLVARGVIADPEVHEEDAAWLLDELLFVRDTHGLAPGDRAEAWFGTPGPPQDALRDELEATRQQLASTAASKRRVDTAFRRAERERARLESEAARAAHHRVLPVQPVEDAEMAALRAEMRDLKGAHKAVHEERNALRREVASLRDALDLAGAEAVTFGPSPEATGPDLTDEDAPGAGSHDPEVRAGLRLPRFPEGFFDRLAAVPGPTAATALRRTGELCGGRATGWRDVKSLQGFDNVWRVRIGRSYRLLFRVHDTHIEVLDLVHRQDLDKRLNQLSSLR